MATTLSTLRKLADQHLVKDPQRVAAVRSAPRPDHGFYGPGSITWRVGQHPGGALLAILRGAIEVLFDPRVAESVSTHSVMRYDPVTRARRSITFFQMAAFGDAESAIRAGRTLYRVHSHINGFDPITGKEYHGTDLDIALWTHALGLIGFIDCYGQFGPGLTEAEQEQLVQENVAFAQLVGIAPENAPKSVADCRKIVDAWMPQMALGVKGIDDVGFLIRSPLTPAWPMAIFGPALRVISTAYARTLAPELLTIAQHHPPKPAVWLAEKTIRALTNALAQPPLRNALMVVSPEGYGMMRQAVEADPGLPLADPKIREDLHLVVRQAGAGSKYSDLEHSPFVSDQAHSFAS